MLYQSDQPILFPNSPKWFSIRKRVPGN